MTEQQRKAIDECLDQFDWERVKQIMEIFDWKWHFDSESRLPTFNELRKTARRLLESALTLGNYVYATGGFVAKANEECFILEFVPVESSSFFADNMETERIEKKGG